MKSIQEKLSEADKVIREVQSLRTLQKKYFQYRELDVLEKCKIQERKVDQMITDYLPQQSKLW